jgi:parvulin-like peptidyl-prolyl isomerase
MNTSRTRLWALSLTAAAAIVTGCAKQQKPQTLTAQAFINPRNASDAPAEGTASTVAPAAPLAADNTLRTPDPILANAVPTPLAPKLTTTPTSLPTIGLSSGQYMTLGGVVAEVNSTPIYANKILATLDPIFRQKAQRLDPGNFRREIRDDIRNTRDELIRIELFYAAAQRTLDADDKRLADVLTINWRMQQITQAGGSVELARRKAREEFGADFDDLVQERSRIELTRIYEQKKIVPRIQVTATDIREYYDKNVNKEYSEPERVKFRLIKVDIKKTSPVSKEPAMDKISGKYKRAKAGEDFKEMAMRENDEKLFAGEEPLEMSPASFSIAKVRDVLTKLQPGEVSDIIEMPDAYYLVKMEEHKIARVRPFEEQAVQDKIRLTLRTEQYRRLREQDFARLMKNAAIRADEDMLVVAIDMAMQKYPQYAAAK